MWLDSVPLRTDLNLTERSGPAPPHGLLTQLRREVDYYTTDFLQQHDALTHALYDALDIPAPRLGRRRRRRRSRRQMATPNLGMLRGAYTSFLGAASGLPATEKKNNNERGVGVGGLPVVLVPQEDPTRCVASPHLSTFGFLGFVLNVVNAVINVANNINNNNNNDNNNDNNNNNNDNNVNQAQITQTATNTNAATAMAGRRIHHLKSMRSSLHRHLRRLRHHTRRRRSTSGSCGGDDVVDEAVVAAAALLDMWGRLVTEEDPWCMAWEICHTAAALAATSRLAGDVGRVGTVAAANMLVNFQGVNPEFLEEAAEKGTDGANCKEVYRACPDFDEASTTTTTSSTTIITASDATTVNFPQ